MSKHRFVIGTWILRCIVLTIAASASVRANEAPASAQSAENKPVQPLGDKTFVAWVAPANLTQHGGSVLTLEAPGGQFDGVVFAELAATKWMAGSEVFARTQKEQSGFAAETADPATFVQMAITYQGQQVTVYRNGKLYSQHQFAGQPQQFGQRSFVIIGKRHKRQGDNAHFAGSIDDARIYDRALSVEEIASLKPNEEGKLPAWAWWTFDDPQAKERTGRFGITELSGNAKVENGKLVLDGKSATMLARTGARVTFAHETPSRPKNPPANWLRYHLAHPGPGTGMPGDPNCAFYWKGRYHLHYIYTHEDGFSFAHVSSPDMLHWTWHPTTLTPPFTDHGMFSGTGFFTKEGKPAIIYHGEGSGRNQIAIAEDDKLEKWTRPWALEPRIRPDQDGSKIANWDPDCWLDGQTYYALSGGSPGSGKPPTLFKSPDLKSWDYLGLFLTKDMPDVQSDEDISCPNFFKLGGKDMLLCISHNKGCRYYLGEWKNEKFTPSFHARMNWHGWDFFAPESLVTADGRRVMWAWCNLGAPQSGIQSLPRELSLPEDGVLRIKPLRELQSLRENEKSESNVTVKKDSSYRLGQIAGDVLELELTLNPGNATRCGVNVHCDAQGSGGLTIAYEPRNKVLTLGEVRAPFELPPGENLSLRVFLDKNMLEIFANDRQAMVASHDHAAENLGIMLFSQGQDVAVPSVKSWNIKSTYAE